MHLLFAPMARIGFGSAPDPSQGGYRLCLFVNEELVFDHAFPAGQLYKIFAKGTSALERDTGA